MVQSQIIIERGIILEIEEIIELFNKTDKNLYILDFYPFRIKENYKYSQIEFRKNPLFCVAKNKLTYEHNLIFDFIITMWLYADTKIYIFDYKPNLRNYLLHNKVNKFFGFNKLCKLENIKQLKYFTKTIIKEYSTAYIVFENFLENETIYMFLDCTNGLIYIDNLQQKEAIEKIATNNHLFIRKQ